MRLRDFEQHTEQLRDLVAAKAMDETIILQVRTMKVFVAQVRKLINIAYLVEEANYGTDMNRAMKEFEGRYG